MQDDRRIYRARLLLYFVTRVSCALQHDRRRQGLCGGLRDTVRLAFAVWATRELCTLQLSRVECSRMGNPNARGKETTLHPSSTYRHADEHAAPIFALTMSMPMKLA